MKNVLKICVYLCSSVACAVAQLQYVDVTSTNWVQTYSSGSQITISGLCTNKSYTTTNPAALIRGDTLTNAFNKLNYDVSLLGYWYGLLTNAPAGGSYPDIADTIGMVGIGQTAPLFTLDVSNQIGNSAGVLHIASYQYTGGPGGFPMTSFDDASNGIPLLHLCEGSDGAGNLNSGFDWFGGGINVGDTPYRIFRGDNYYDRETGYDEVQDSLYDDGGGNFFWELNTGGGDENNVVFAFSGANGYMQFSTGPGTYLTPQDQYGNPVGIGIGNSTPAYILDITGTCGDSVDGTWNVDASGNFNAYSYNLISDANQKTNLVPYAPANLLNKLAAIPMYSWKFKERQVIRTNTHNRVIWGTNWVAKTNAHTHLVVTNAVRVPVGTNTVVSVRTNNLPGQRHIGPMAQDWNALFNLGGGSNVINTTDMQGVLLAGEQALAQQVGTIPWGGVNSSTNPCVPGQVQMDARWLYLAVGTNTWRRIAIPTNSW